jgi:hypothetical protein
VAIENFVGGEPVLDVVMPGLDPGIHVFLSLCGDKDVDGRGRPGHDEKARSAPRGKGSQTRENLLHFLVISALWG